jgi:ketosteroid isomerase-like protein
VGTAEEAVVAEFMDAWGDGARRDPDVEKIMSMLSDDITWQLWVPGGPTLRGRDAIRADIERQLGFATFMRCGPVHVASNGGVVFTERTDEFRSRDPRRPAPPRRRVRGRRRGQDLRVARVLRPRRRQPATA